MTDMAFSRQLLVTFVVAGCTAKRQAKKQLRQEVSERAERGGAMTDQTVTDVWTDALGYVRDYVARTLNKS